MSRRIESYSCKLAGIDKQLFKQFCQEGQPHALEALSPPQTAGISPGRYRSHTGIMGSGIGISTGIHTGIGGLASGLALGSTLGSGDWDWEICTGIRRLGSGLGDGTRIQGSAPGSGDWDHGIGTGILAVALGWAPGLWDGHQDQPGIGGSPPRMRRWQWVQGMALGLGTGIHTRIGTRTVGLAPGLGDWDERIGTGIWGWH